MHILNSMTISASRESMLTTLRENREKHSAIVKEARAGYMAAAREALKGRLEELERGKFATLHFSLEPPRDHTKVYDTAIRLLELHLEDAITLDAEQVRHLVMDEWDWSRQFIVTNSAYSGTARERLEHEER
jgi:hypothetical protein